MPSPWSDYTSHHLGSYIVRIPKGFKRVPLPIYRKWLNALESGKFKKGQGVLCDGDNYCCLGVLSKIQGRLLKYRGYLRDGAEEAGLSANNPLYHILNNYGNLPAGVKITNRKHGGFIGSLAGLNDETKDFSKVIAVIKLLFKQEIKK